MAPQAQSTQSKVMKGVVQALVFVVRPGNSRH